jgi:hypothetical protein
MTLEKKLIIGLDDIKRVYFECKKCGARSIFAQRSMIKVPHSCQGCSAPFIAGDYDESPAVKFIDNFLGMQKATDSGLRILLELDAS